jgi:hypothetical protein
MVYLYWNCEHEIIHREEQKLSVEDAATEIENKVAESCRLKKQFHQTDYIFFGPENLYPYTYFVLLLLYNFKYNCFSEKAH